MLSRRDWPQGRDERESSLLWDAWDIFVPYSNQSIACGELQAVEDVGPMYVW